MGLFDSIGSGLRKVGSGIKDGLTGAGHLVGEAASNPWVQGLTAAGLAATGVGAPAAAAIMAAERGGGALLKDGGNIGDAARGGAEGAAAGAGASMFGNGVRRILGRGVGGAMSSADGGAGTDAGGDDMLGGFGSTLRRLGNGVQSQESGGGGFWNTAGDFLKNNGADMALGGLAGEQGLQAAHASARAGALSDKALSLADENWNQGADLRAAGKAGILNRSTHDLSDVYGTNSGPFAARRRRVSV